jgi:hypothetical protein
MHASRALATSPGFAFAAIVTLAAGTPLTIVAIRCQ